MGLQIRCYVEGEQKYLDLYGNEDITIDVSFAEIQDITKRNSAYTQEFKIPGSNNNNDIFNYFFDINSVPLDWNPKKKFEASLIYNGYEIFNGNIRLNAVTIDVREKIYSITFYAQVGDLASNIGDKALCNVDTSSLNHSLYDENVAGNLWIDPSLHPTSLLNPSNPYINPVTDGDVQYIIGQRGYDYTGNTFGDIRDINVSQTPLLDFSGGTPGFFDSQFTPLSSPYLIPSIRTRKLYELIVNQADYQIESEFFNTDYFGRYYIPLSFNTDSSYMAQAVKYQYTSLNLSGDTLPGGGDYWDINTFNPPTTVNEFVFKSKDLIIDNLGINPIDPADYSQRPNLSQVSDYLFALPTSPNQKIELNIEIDFEYTEPPVPDGLLDFIGEVKLYNYFDNTSSTIDASKLYTPTIPIIVNTAIGPQTGTLSRTYTIDKPLIFNNLTSLQFITVNWFVLNWATITRIKVSTTNKPTLLPTTIELYKEMGCDHKQIEFIQNVNKMFNLVVVPHPIKPKTLIIEPIVNWIGKGRQLDWTDKVDYNSPQTLRPTTSIINGSIFSSNKADKDYVNTQYTNKSNKIFGQKIIDLGVDYKNSTINLTQTLGQNTDYYLNATGSTNVAIPCYFITKENNNNGKSVFEYRPFRSLPRMTFKSIPLQRGNTGQGPIFYRYDINPLGLVSMGDIQNINRLTTYPFNISGFSHYTIYDSTTVFTPDELVYPEVQTQYDRYYKDYIDDLISEENKIYTCKMYLKPWEVSQLYFNEVIFIKNAKFRINKITNLSLMEPGMCDVELVKLTKDYTTTPTLYYDLVSCDNNCDIIHSNTDLNYLLWAFEGSYVNIGLSGYESRYKVVRTEYNENYTYQNVWITNRITTGGVNPNDYNIYWNYSVFSGCTGDPINNLDPKDRCVNVLVQNTTGENIELTYENCDGETETTIIPSDGSVNVCGFYGSFKGNGLQFCPDISNNTPC